MRLEMSSTCSCSILIAGRFLAHADIGQGSEQERRKIMCAEKDKQTGTIDTDTNFLRKHKCKEDKQSLKQIVLYVCVRVLMIIDVIDAHKHKQCTTR